MSSKWEVAHLGFHSSLCGQSGPRPCNESPCVLGGQHCFPLLSLSRTLMGFSRKLDKDLQWVTSSLSPSGPSALKTALFMFTCCIQFCSCPYVVSTCLSYECGGNLDGDGGLAAQRTGSGSGCRSRDWGHGFISSNVEVAGGQSAADTMS